MDRSELTASPTIIVPTLLRCDGVVTASRAQARAGMPSRTLIAVDYDRKGFTRTVNEALKEVKEDAVILVDDCEVPENWLRDLHDAVYERQKLNAWFAGPSGPCRTYPQAGGLPNDKRRPRIVAHLAGFCLYATADAVAMGLDERFIHYASDVHWQREANRLFGAQSLWVPSVYVNHGLHPPHQEWWEHDQQLLAEIWRNPQGPLT